VRDRGGEAMIGKNLKIFVLIGAVVIIGLAIHTHVLADDPSQGKVLYHAHCVQCHGIAGDGNGPDAANYNPRPKDFTSQQMLEVADPVIEKAVLAGLPTVPTHSWGTKLSNDEVAAVVQYVRTFRQ
jgi:mono/diheme cytochrome c family protein